jgi:hypothetical protein
MSLEVMAFILGGLLVGAGIFGGGLEIKELKLPQIAGFARAASLTIGAAFIALAIFLNPKPPGTGPVTVTFQAPMYDGMRLDACFEWGKRCVEKPATAWCKTQGFSRSIEHPVENVGERGVSTKLIGTQQVCSEKFCASFEYITCEK